MILDEGEDSLIKIFKNNYQYIKNVCLIKMMIELYKSILKNYTLIRLGSLIFANAARCLKCI